METLSFEAAFGEVRSLLQQAPLETVWHQGIEFNESPTWEQYRALDRALDLLVAHDPERARAEVDAYITAQLEHSAWCMRPAYSITYGDEDIDGERAQEIARCFPSLFILYTSSLEELDAWAKKFPDHKLGLAFDASKLSEQQPFAAHPDVPNLTHLDMGCARLREKNCDLVAPSALFHNLTSLDLSNTQLRDEGLRLLQDAHVFDGLSELSLAGTNISGSGMRRLFSRIQAPLEALDVSRIDHGRWQDPFIAISKQTAFSGLRSLRADMCEFRDEAFEALANATHIEGLEVLSAAYGWFKKETAAKFVTSEVASNLKRLDLSNARITKVAFKHLVDATFAPSLHTLSLSSIDLKPWAVEILARTPFESLRTLDLSNCSLDDDAIELLASAPWFGGLEDLNLNGNEVGERGALAIARAPFTHTWRNLQFDGCEIGDAALTELAGSLRMKTIAFLNLQYAGISRVGLRALIDADHIESIEALYFTNDEVRLTEDDHKAMSAASHFTNTYM